MQLAEVYLVTERVKRVPVRTLDALENSLAFPLPLGYREYLTQLGVGRFSSFLSVYVPQQVKLHLRLWREQIADVVVDGIEVGTYTKGGLSAKRVREAVPFAGTDNGDTFVSTPSCGNSLFVIPHCGPTIRKLRNGFLDPMACCRAVGVNDAHPWFEAANGRQQSSNFAVRGGAPVVEKALRERWGGREIRCFGTVAAGSWGSVTCFGVRAVEGLVKVYGKPRGGHIATVSYDKHFAGEVRGFVKAVGSSKQRA